MKKAFFLLAVMGLSASLSAQSLADLARKEKARRESFKGRHAVVIRNVDLMRVQKVPAVEIAYPDEMFGSEEQLLEPGTAGAEEAGLSGALPGVVDASSPQAAPAESPFETSAIEEPAPVPRGSSSVALDAQLNAARDMVDLLTTKMNALRQQYEYQDAMVPGYVIQEQLVETEKRLLKAQTQLARIEAQARRTAR